MNNETEQLRTQCLLLQSPETNLMGFFSSALESLGTPEGKKVILAFGNLGKRHSERFTVFQLLSLLNLINIL